MSPRLMRPLVAPVLCLLSIPFLAHGAMSDKNGSLLESSNGAYSARVAYRGAGCGDVSFEAVLDGGNSTIRLGSIAGEPGTCQRL